MSFATEMVETLQERLRQLVGVKETSTDGEKTVFQDLTKQLEYWERRVAIEEGTKPRISVIQMGGS